MGNYDVLYCMKYFYFVCRIHFKSIKGKIPINHSKSSNRVPPRNIYLNPLIFYSAISALSATWCNYNWEEKDYSRSEQCGEISFRSHTIFKSKKFWTPSCIRHLSFWAIYPRRPSVSSGHTCLSGHSPSSLIFAEFHFQFIFKIILFLPLHRSSGSPWSFYVTKLWHFQIKWAWAQRIVVKFCLSTCGRLFKIDCAKMWWGRVYWSGIIRFGLSFLLLKGWGGERDQD